MTKVQKMAIILTVFMIFIMGAVVTQAAKAAQTYGANHETKECAEFFMGDECMVCSLPDGWEMIGFEMCPNDYNDIQADSVCEPRKDKFCLAANNADADQPLDDPENQPDSKTKKIVSLLISVAFLSFSLWIFLMRKQN